MALQDYLRPATNYVQRAAQSLRNEIQELYDQINELKRQRDQHTTAVHQQMQQEQQLISRLDQEKQQTKSQIQQAIKDTQGAIQQTQDNIKGIDNQQNVPLQEGEDPQIQRTMQQSRVQATALLQSQRTQLDQLQKQLSNVDHMKTDQQHQHAEAAAKADKELNQHNQYIERSIQDCQRRIDAMQHDLQELQQIASTLQNNQ